MAITTSSGVPATIQAGDTTPWTDSYADHPADTWELRYFFTREGSDPIEILATASGTDYAVTLTEEDSGQFSGGRWSWAARVTKQGTGSNIVETGCVDVLRDPTAKIEESFAVKALAMIEKSFAGDLPTAQESYNALGVDITKMPLMERYSLRDKFRAEIGRERDARRRQEGVQTLGTQLVFK